MGKIACQTLQPSCSPRSRPIRSRLKRPRRLPPSTWPSSGRPSKSWRRRRRGPSWPRLSCASNLKTAHDPLLNSDPGSILICLFEKSPQISSIKSEFGGFSCCEIVHLGSQPEILIHIPLHILYSQTLID